MTFLSLSASVSCLMVLSWGPAQSWGGALQSEGFISCRLRQKAATCSVLFGEKGEERAVVILEVRAGGTMWLRGGCS